MIQEYIDAGIDPRQVFAQSFSLADVVQWIHEFPTFGLQAVYLISESPADPLAGPPSVISENPPTLEEFVEVRNMGVNIIAPPMPVLLTDQREQQTDQAVPLCGTRQAGGLRPHLLDDRALWSHRGGTCWKGGDTFYYQTTLDALTNDGDILRTIDVLAQDVGIIGLFSDWPATTTFYANCLK